MKISVQTVFKKIQKHLSSCLCITSPGCHGPVKDLIPGVVPRNETSRRAIKLLMGVIHGKLKEAITRIIAASAAS